VPCGVLALALVILPATAWAQNSREETITQLQAEKATRLKPHEPNKVEQVLNQMQDALTVTPSGFYPVFDTVYSGGGFTLGAGYRRFIGDRLNWNVTGLYSIKNYKLIELTLHSPRPETGRFDFSLTTGWRDATRVGFHGLGIDSPENRATYRMQQGYIGGDASFRPKPWTVFRGGLTSEAYTLSDGGGDYPDVDDVYTPDTAPGLGDNPDYLHASASAALDTRPSPGYARRGSLVEIAYHRYNDYDDVYSFDRVDTEIIQHIPVLREQWVLSLRGRLQTTVGDTDLVPYFLLPSLGSGRTLRGYRSWRFRDRHALLLSAEWRWIPNRMALDAALFFDAGTVADRRDALSLGDMKGDVGVGVRFHSPVATPLRIELAKGQEGFKLVFASSAAF
jgi:outer membrane protein assembly factor BamA